VHGGVVGSGPGRPPARGGTGHAERSGTAVRRTSADRVSVVATVAGVTRTAASRLLLGVLTTALVVPAVSLATTDPPRHYAWNMFTGGRTEYRYAGETTAGDTVPVDPAAAGTPWSSVHHGPQTPAALCAARPELVRVVRYADAEIEGTYPC